MSHASSDRIAIPRRIDVAGLRRRLGLTQAQFAARYGFSLTNIRNWEQRAARPSSTARVYLTVIDRAPDAVARALRVA